MCADRRATVDSQQQGVGCRSGRGVTHCCFTNERDMHLQRGAFLAVPQHTAAVLCARPHTLHCTHPTHSPASGASMLTLKPTDDTPLELFLLYCPGDLQGGGLFHGVVCSDNNNNNNASSSVLLQLCGIYKYPPCCWLSAPRLKALSISKTADTRTANVGLPTRHPTHLPSMEGLMALLTGFSDELYVCDCGRFTFNTAQHAQHAHTRVSTKQFGCEVAAAVPNCNFPAPTARCWPQLLYVTPASCIQLITQRHTPVNLHHRLS